VADEELEVALPTVEPAALDVAPEPLVEAPVLVLRVELREEPLPPPVVAELEPQPPAPPQA